MRDYQESVTTGQTDRQTPDKVIPMCRYASQATQKVDEISQSEAPQTFSSFSSLIQEYLEHSKMTISGL